MPATTLRVSLLSMTPDALSLIYAAFRQCYHAGSVADMWPRLLSGEIDKGKQAEFVSRILDSGHESPIEHVSFTFAVSGVSRALTHQLVRHRISSYSQQSQRYVKAGEEFGYILPKSIEESGMGADYIIHMAKVARFYARLTDAGIPPEDARFVLPNACETRIVVTMNCRSLLHFFEQRCCQRAQWEIRALANTMLGICREKLPVVFETAGAACERDGFCREEKSCGRKTRLKDLMEKYADVEAEGEK